MPADERAADAAKAVGAHAEARLRRRDPSSLRSRTRNTITKSRTGRRTCRRQEQRSAAARARSDGASPSDVENPADAAHGLWAPSSSAGRLVAPGALALALAGGARRPRHARRRLGRGPRRRSHALTFYRDRRRAGRLHAGSRPAVKPSYEDRRRADPVFARQPTDQRASGRRLGRRARTPRADAATSPLHHLTPIHEAALRRFPNVPVVTELHGTELGMLREIDAGAATPFATEWAERMRLGRGLARLVGRPGIADEAAEGSRSARTVRRLPGGVDLSSSTGAVTGTLSRGAGSSPNPRGGQRVTPAPSATPTPTSSDRGGPPLVFRRPLHGGEAAAAPAARPRPRESAVGHRVPLILVGGHPVERGRASAEARARASSSGLAHHSATSRSDQRIRPRGSLVAPRSLRPRAREGDGLRRAGRRHGLAGAVPVVDDGRRARPCRSTTRRRSRAPLVRRRRRAGAPAPQTARARTQPAPASASPRCAQT